MQYCKNCGRQLKEGTRFCDRCGQSVRQSRNSESSRKQKEIERLQRERLSRKRKQEQRENIENRKRERRNQRRKKQNKVLLIVGGLVGAVLIIAIISFVVTTQSIDDSEWVTNSSIIAETEESALPTMKPSETERPATPEPTNTSDNYSTYRFSNDMRISYPKDFTDEDIEGDEELRISARNGDAIMTVSVSEYPGGSPSELMKSFAAKYNGKVTYSLAGTDWYGITVESDDTIIHRKYIIDRDNDLSLYYDFEYASDSGYIDDYEEYISYIDKGFSIGE